MNNNKRMLIPLAGMLGCAVNQNRGPQAVSSDAPIVGTATTNAPQGPLTINQGITYWDLYWSGLCLFGILIVLYYLREMVKYGANPIRILKGLRK